MKILHTSDWHLGQEFYTYDRTQEHEAFLAQLRDIVAEEQPDVMVVSGDIYHNATPSNAVMRMFTDRLDMIRNACPLMQIVITAGNHDSSARLEVTRTLWKHLGVYVIGRIEKNEDGVDFNRLIIPIRDKESNVCGYVIALPHVFPQSFPQLEEQTPRDERQNVFFRTLAEKIKEVNLNHLPVIMMAHMAITGSDITGHDEIRGGMDYVNLADLQVGYDYLALGHIHCPQLINDAHARYCGSPIPVSFDENYEHSVTIVELHKQGDLPALRYVPIKNPWPVKTFPKEAVPFEEAMQLLTHFPDDEQAYIRLHVTLDDVAPTNAFERAYHAIEKKNCRFCCFKWERKGALPTQQRKFSDVDQMKAESPLRIAELFYENKFGKPLDDDLKEMLNEVIEQVERRED